MIIIFPTITSERRFKYYGIFNDGIPAIIQAIGRLRNGGDIHIIMHDTKEILGNKADYPISFDEHTEREYFVLNDIYKKLKEAYRENTSSLTSVIRFMEEDIKKTKVFRTLDYKSHFGFWYPNFNEYLLMQQKLITKLYPTYGKGLSPYILWACLNNQIANGTLHTLLYHKSALELQVDEYNAPSSFTLVLTGKKEEILSTGFRECLNKLKDLLNTTVDNKQVKYRTEKYTLSAAQLLNKEPGLVKIIISILYQLATGKSLNLEDNARYFHSCIQTALTKKPSKSTIVKSYQNMEMVLKNFKAWFNEKIVELDGMQFISNNAYDELDESFVLEFEEVLNNLRNVDVVLKWKAISFLQHLNNVDITEKKRMIFNELIRLYFNMQPDRKQIKGEQYKKIKSLPQPTSRMILTQIL